MLLESHTLNSKKLLFSLMLCEAWRICSVFMLCIRGNPLKPAKNKHIFLDSLL